MTSKSKVGEKEKIIKRLMNQIIENRIFISHKPFIIEKEDLPKYFMGVDLAFRLKWWQKVLVWLGFKNRWQDYSCSTVWKKRKDGTLELVDLNTF